MPLLEVVGNAFRLDPEQIGATAVKVGVTIGFTTIVILVVEIQDPDGDGVKVYSVVLVLSMTGDQIPVILLFEIVGNAGIISP